MENFKYQLKNIQKFQHTIELVIDIFQFYMQELEIIVVIYFLIYIQTIYHLILLVVTLKKSKMQSTISLDAQTSEMKEKHFSIYQ